MKESHALPVSPSLESARAAVHLPSPQPWISPRVMALSAVSAGLGLIAALVAKGLVLLIALATNVFFLQRLSFAPAAPSDAAPWGLWIVFIPVLGGVIVGLMARYGSRAIRGHGIPEAMEQILLNESRIPARVAVLKPLSAAISIGTGGPFGAEGPIIATGGALGSLVGQFMKVTAAERKVLLASGAAAGMTAIFGTPVAAVLLAIELLLFEFRPQSLIPVAMASAAAGALRAVFFGRAPAFAMPDVELFKGSALFFYVLLGALSGVVATAVTRIVYAIEDAFERLPIHWMWWPALGGVAVGVIGYFFPRTLGVGYDNIEAMLSGKLAASAITVFCLAKFVSWSISLGSGTSGGTLAPLLTIGGGLGALFGLAFDILLPNQGIDPRISALVGMAAIFAGASRALLASAVFAFEATRQMVGLLPLLAGCSMSYLVSGLLMRTSIMTEKIERRGVRVPSGYSADDLERLRVSEFASRDVKVLQASDRVDEIRAKLIAGDSELVHQGFPVLDSGRLVGVLTRKDLLERVQSGTELREVISRLPIVVREEDSLRHATDLMSQEGIGRIPVVNSAYPDQLRGILTRSDIIRAFQGRIRQDRNASRVIGKPQLKKPPNS